jgi:3-hydroxybutyryl-CoA dehydrogenase
MDDAKKIETVCVCGAGTMGSGIVQVAAQSGFNVIQFDVDEAMLDKSKVNIRKGLQYLVEKNKITEAEKNKIKGNILFTNKREDCIADIIIEAIFENKNAKVELFNKLAAINNSETIFATNTSSISVSEIASETKNPLKVVGMHFFNPAPVMKLVEVIRAEETSESVVQHTFQLAKDFGKTPVVCKDAPGFIVNRVARHYYLEAMKLIEEALASVETIDEMMEATGFKMGPFKLMDLIGMDVNFSVSNIVYEALGKPERLKPSIIQQQKVNAGQLGRKTGKGFYQY